MWDVHSLGWCRTPRGKSYTGLKLVERDENNDIGNSLDDTCDQTSLHSRRIAPRTEGYQ